MDFLKYAFPVILNEVLWGLGTATNTAVLGHMGSAAVAANSVAQVARQLATVVAFGLSSATAIYLGKTIGEKKYEHAKAYAKRFVWLSVIMGVVGGVLILLISPVMAETMTLSETAKGYMRFMFFVMSIQRWSWEPSDPEEIPGLVCCWICLPCGDARFYLVRSQRLCSTAAFLWCI